MTQEDVPARKRGAEIMLQKLAVGARLILRDGTEVEIVENPRDGQWIFARPAGSDLEPDLVFAGDVVELVSQ